MGKRADRIINESKKVRELFYGKEYPCKVRDCQYQDYISDNKSNSAVLDSLLSGKGIKLVIAPPGSGKSTAILSRSDELVSKNKDYRVIFDLPTRALTSQMGNNTAANITTLMGGDSFDEESHLIATTYEKMYEVEERIAYQKEQGTTEKNVLVLDESHLLTTQHTFRQDAIKDIISCIEKNYFHSIVLVTATPEPMSLFHYDEILEFYSNSKNSSIDRLEIIEVDDPVEYIKGIDYSKEFPFIRLNNTKIMDELIAQMPQTMEKITSADRKKKAYLDIVEHGKIDSTGINGILATCVLEAGVSITDYPDNIVPIAVFPDNNISVDDIEQFLNRIRAKGNKHVKCARVIVRKPKQKEIKVSLFPYKAGDCICVFQDIHMEKGNLTINDTRLLDTIPDGKYRVHFEIGDNAFDRYIKVVSDGTTNDKVYSKKNTSPITFEGIGFRELYDILKQNYMKKDKLSYSLKALEQLLEGKRQELNLSEDELEIEKIENETFIKRMFKGYIHQEGEIGTCFSYINNEVVVDNRICFETSYRQYQRQYYHNHDILAEELKFRLDTDVVLMEQNTPKGKRVSCNKEEIWAGIEDLREEVKHHGYERFWKKVMGEYDSLNSPFFHWKTVNMLKEQDHLIEILKKLKKEGITGQTALRILTSSKSEKKINEYIRCFHMISYNQILEESKGVAMDEVPCYKGQKRELLLQKVIYCYLEEKGVQSPSVKKIKKEILEYYKQSYPNEAKFPTERKIGQRITKMYKSRGKDRIDKQLRTNINEIFSLLESDYEKK